MVPLFIKKTFVVVFIGIACCQLSKGIAADAEEITRHWDTRSQRFKAACLGCCQCFQLPLRFMAFGGGAVATVTTAAAAIVDDAGVKANLTWVSFGLTAFAATCKGLDAFIGDQAAAAKKAAADALAQAESSQKVATDAMAHIQALRHMQAAPVTARSLMVRRDADAQRSDDTAAATIAELEPVVDTGATLALLQQQNDANAAELIKLRQRFKEQRIIMRK